jgi:hypothetical protein
LYGSSAHKRVYKWEGDFHSEYMHPECYRAMLDAPSGVLEDGWTVGDMIRGRSDGESGPPQYSTAYEGKYDKI